MATMANRFSRICLEDSLAYARKRKTFGKPLISHQVYPIANNPQFSRFRVGFPRWRT